MHRGQLGLVREHGRQDHRLVHCEESAIFTVFWDLKNDCDVGTVEGQALLDGLLDGVSVGSLVVLEPPDLGVGLGQVLVRVPVAILERFDPTILLESDPRLVVWRIYLIREVHVLLRPLLHCGLLLVAQTVNVWIDLVLFIILICFITFSVIFIFRNA